MQRVQPKVCKLIEVMLIMFFSSFFAGFVHNGSTMIAEIAKDSDKKKR